MSRLLRFFVLFLIFYSALSILQAHANCAKVFGQDIEIAPSPGFFKPGVREGGELISPQVLQQKDSVFQIFVLSPEIESVLLTDREVEHYRREVMEHTRGHNRVWRLYNLMSQNGLGSIEIHRGVAVGSAFLLRDSKTLVTARHTLMAVLKFPDQYRNALTYEDASQSLKGFHPEILIVNSSGQVVLDSRKSEVEIEIGINGHWSYSERFDPRLQSWDRSSKAVVSELIELKLGVELEGRPLELAEKIPKRGDRVYIIGYPEITEGRRSQFNVPDSDGEAQYISHGQIIDIPPFYLNRLKERPVSQEALESFIESRVFTSADAVGGSTGGPILNEQGQVVGMQTRQFNQKNIPLEKVFSGLGGHGISSRLLSEIK